MKRVFKVNPVQEKLDVERIRKFGMSLKQKNEVLTQKTFNSVCVLVLFYVHKASNCRDHPQPSANPTVQIQSRPPLHLFLLHFIFQNQP